MDRSVPGKLIVRATAIKKGRGNVWLKVDNDFRVEVAIDDVQKILVGGHNV